MQSGKEKEIHMKTSENQWTDDKAAEACMKMLGLTWKIEMVPVSKINLAKSWNNHARIRNPKMPEIIGEYATSMRQGAVFPRAVMFLLKDKRYDIAGGNHRTAAGIEAGFPDIGSYTVETDDSLILDLLPRILNQCNGVRIPKDEAIEGALSAVLQKGVSVQDAARMFGLNEKSFTRDVLAKKVSNHLASIGVDTNRLPRELFVRLNGATKNDNVLTACIDLFRKGKYTVEVFIDVLKRMKEGFKTEASQLHFIEEEAKKLRISTHEKNGSSEKAPKFQQTERSKFLMWLTTGERRLLERDTYEKNQITSEEEQREISKRLLLLAKKLNRMAKQS